MRSRRSASLCSSQSLLSCSALSHHMHRRSVYLELVGRSSDFFTIAIFRFSISFSSCSTIDASIPFLVVVSRALGCWFSNPVLGFGIGSETLFSSLASHCPPLRVSHDDIPHAFPCFGEATLLGGHCHEYIDIMASPGLEPKTL